MGLMSKLAGIGLGGALAAWGVVTYKETAMKKEAKLHFIAQPKPAYDYIIVGAGSAGCVLANRLSANPDVTVLLLEAGSDDRDCDEFRIPGRAIKVMDQTNFYDFFKVEPKPGNEVIHPGGHVTIARGRVLGGCGTVNYLAFVRGSRHDFDKWAELTGDDSWSYKSLLPYFKRSEKVDDPTFLGDPYHSTEGELGLTKNKMLSTILHEALKEIGLSFNPDPNGATMQGFGTNWCNIASGERQSTSTAFLRPVMGNRPNLDVVLNAKVNKVVIEERTAKGVEVDVNGQKQTVQSDREVILSAGALVSPQLLMLSGIGPKKHLEELGIKVKVDLPVGENLHDHVKLNIPVQTDRPLQDKDYGAPESIWNRLRYKLFRSGALADFSKSMTFGSMAFTGSTQYLKDIDWPDIQIMFSNKCDPDPYVANTNPKVHGFSCAAVLARPASRGQLKLQSKDLSDSPIITMNYLEQPQDKEVLRKAINVCEELVDSKTMRNIGARYKQSWCPECDKHGANTEEFWSCAMKTRHDTVQHPVGTCKMGKVDDRTAVVDSQLRVKGDKGLRVVDASVMPNIVSSNIQPAVIVIAEKGSAFINGEEPLPAEDAARMKG